jgi:rhodanese-related sulfurtransferase
VETVGTDEARQLVASNEVAVIDLRDEEGWREGFIVGARRVDPEADDELDDLPKEGKLLVVCADGKRSAEVASRLRDGDRDAVSLEGGMDAWMSAGLATQPSSDYEPGPAVIPDAPDAEDVAGMDEAPEPQDAEDAAEDASQRPDDENRAS